ncbi:arabinose ABC transporter permease [Paenibacillus odorifer]|uniref:MFS transporter n=1 Tax=Paenibacillus odorifer TaxID=189426 RepID=UPI00096E33B4|nr:MFS transporter [Paenibacillus odorifer]OME07603.1 arabinose ABC transporter permease [Paenibacillus odorifer]
MSKRNNLFIFILTLGVFGILNTEMGVVGILPQIAERFHVSVSQAGLLVSLFALAVAISGPILPLLFSGINRRKVLLFVLGVFVLSNIVSIFAPNFTIALIARVIPAFLHPVYVSIALTAAASSVSEKEVPKAVSKVILGVSAGIVIGVPITTFIASATSLDLAMTFFAVVNAIAFMGVLLFVPSMPVKERLSYGAQLSVLKKPIIWQSITAVVFINAATAGVYSYFAEYLETITHISGTALSLMLVIFGVASLFGNVLGGKLLSKNAIKSVVIYPFVFGAVYILLFLMGKFTAPMIIIVVLWGILYAISNNISQYWITSAAPEAPEFANGLFLTAGNLGITIGTTVGGLFISGMGTQYIVLGGLLFLILSLIFILLRTFMYSPNKQLAK